MAFFYLEECTVGSGNNIKTCHGTACSWSSPLDIKRGEGKCENIGSHALPILDLVTELILFEKEKNEEEKDDEPVRVIFKHCSSMKFWCELNNCNNQNIGEQVKEAITKQYDIWAIQRIYRPNRKRIIQ